jgi:hypothetical protein
MNAEAELQNQNERLELLLNLTASITSSLDLRGVLRAIASKIREVVHADGVAVSLPDIASGIALLTSPELTGEFLREYGAVREVWMQNLFQLGVRDAQLPAPNSSHTCNGGVLERVA